MACCAALRPATLRSDSAAITLNAIARLCVMPVLAGLVGRAMGLTGAEALVLIIFFAIPTAPTAYVLTRQFGGDGTYMAGLITAQTMAAVVTIPLILLIFGAA